MYIKEQIILIGISMHKIMSTISYILSILYTLLDNLGQFLTISTHWLSKSIYSLENLMVILFLPSWAHFNHVGHQDTFNGVGELKSFVI